MVKLKNLAGQAWGGVVMAGYETISDENICFLAGEQLEGAARQVQRLGGARLLRLLHNVDVLHGL